MLLLPLTLAVDPGRCVLQWIPTPSCRGRSFWPWWATRRGSVRRRRWAEWVGAITCCAAAGWRGRWGAFTCTCWHPGVMVPARLAALHAHAHMPRPTLWHQCVVASQHTTLSWWHAALDPAGCCAGRGAAGGVGGDAGVRRGHRLSQRPGGIQDGGRGGGQGGERGGLPSPAMRRLQFAQRRPRVQTNLHAGFKPLVEGGSFSSRRSLPLLLSVHVSSARQAGAAC